MLNPNAQDLRYAVDGMHRTAVNERIEREAAREASPEAVDVTETEVNENA